MFATNKPVYALQPVKGRLSGVLRDKVAGPLFIGCDDKQQILDLLAPWSKRFTFYTATSGQCDLELPGGAMALIATAIDQWGPLP